MLTPIVGSTATRGLKGARNILCLTLGLPMSVVVHEANVHDSVGADGVIDKMKGCFPDWKRCSGGRRIQRTEIGRYRTPKARCGVYRCSPSGRVSEEILRAATPERSFSWLENFRRIAIDHEFYSDTGEAMVQLAFCRLMYNKLCD